MIFDCGLLNVPTFWALTTINPVSSNHLQRFKGHQSKSSIRIQQSAITNQKSSI